MRDITTTDAGEGTPSNGEASAPGKDFRRLRRGAAVMTALAVFSQEAVWNFYDAQVPAVLKEYTASAAVIGFLMGMDNLFGIFIQPYFAHRSDKLAPRKWGRLPYILVGAPVAALFFVLIPWAHNMWTLLICIFCFAIVGNAFKSVTEALVPDYQSPRHRGKAYAMAKVSTALTIGVSAGVSYFVVDRNLPLAFMIPATLLVIGMLLAAWGLRRCDSYIAEESAEQAEPDSTETIKDLFVSLFSGANKSRLWMIVAIFATAGTWSALRSQGTPYAMEVLGLTKGEGGALALPGGVAFIAAILPVAILSDRGNRMLICRLGCMLFSAGCLIALCFPTTVMTATGLAIASVGYSAFAVNGVVIMWNLAPDNRSVGAYTGLYSVASACGATVGPAVVGTLIDLTSWHYMMLHVALLALISAALIGRVKDARATV